MDVRYVLGVRPLSILIFDAGTWYKSGLTISFEIALKPIATHVITSLLAFEYRMMKHRSNTFIVRASTGYVPGTYHCTVHAKRVEMLACSQVPYFLIQGKLI